MAIPETIRYPAYLQEEFDFPLFYRVRISWPRPRVDDLAAAVRRAVSGRLKAVGIRRGDRVCIGVGSRGIRDIAAVAALVCEEIRQTGGKPFIMPAMGSHGGGTPEGQRATLERLGVTEASCGCPVVSSLQVQRVATLFGEVPVYYAQDALAADHAICINRIKPHTKFKGSVESGLVKMLCIGMGKHEGALSYHTWALKYGFHRLLQEMGRTIAGAVNFRFGLGIVENAYDETMRIEGLAVEGLVDGEAELLKLARENMPRLPVREADALIVYEFGKNISGSGMDPNVTGRAPDLMEDDFSGNFRAARLAALNLTAASAGNALGVGVADIITRKIFDAMDYETTLMNILTSFSLKKAAIPVIMPTDEKAIQAALLTAGPITVDRLRAIIIKNTLELSECWVSGGLLAEVRRNPMAEVVEEVPLRFDSKGNLLLLP